jgi:hypothetical protein|tara:strand:+ start:756 stop:1031 length:276 start_codon:yes stop_codon:yes gene_type:complete
MKIDKKVKSITKDQLDVLMNILNHPDDYGVDTILIERDFKPQERNIRFKDSWNIKAKRSIADYEIKLCADGEILSSHPYWKSDHPNNDLPF